MWKTTKGTVLGTRPYKPEDEDKLIIAPEISDTVPYRTEVLASGVEGVEVGDIVLFAPDGRTYKAAVFLESAGGQELVNVHELCILGVIGKE